MFSPDLFAVVVDNLFSNFAVKSITDFRFAANSSSAVIGCCGAGNSAVFV
jgi:hypothetical protein